jgi:hypothetical protein
VWNVGFDKRFYAASGFTNEQRLELDYDDPRKEVLSAACYKLYKEFPAEEDETEGDELAMSGGMSPRPL